MTFTFLDLFAGAGGFSIGAERAGGKLLWACNHDEVACEYHARHFPDAAHAREDLRLVDFRALRAKLIEQSGSQRPSLIVASPSCTGHTRARGGEQPRHREARSTAWCVIDALEALRPSRVIVENVPEFASWSMYPSWLDAMRRLGYATNSVVLDAAECGVPQNRVRLFVVGALGHKPPDVTSPMMDPVSASRFIDFGDAYRWSPVAKPGRAEKTLARVAAGRAEHGDRFLIAYYGSTSGGRSIHRPIGTITTVDRYAVVRGDEMRMLACDELRVACGFPPDFALPGHRAAVRLLGNSVPPPLAETVVRQVMR